MDGVSLSADAVLEQIRHDQWHAPEARCPLPVTEWAMSHIAPHEWQRVADFLTGLVGRKPLTGPMFEPHRLLLGALAAELRLNAREREA